MVVGIRRRRSAGVGQHVGVLYEEIGIKEMERKIRDKQESKTHGCNLFLYMIPWIKSVFLAMIFLPVN